MASNERTQRTDDVSVASVCRFDGVWEWERATTVKNLAVSAPAACSDRLPPVAVCQQHCTIVLINNYDCQNCCDFDFTAYHQ